MSRGWMKIVRHVWMQLAGPFEVDHCVDNDVGNMDALWSEFTCDRLGEDPLGGFGWRETSEIGLAAQRRRVAGGDDHAVTRFDHRRRQPANEMQQSHDVDLEVSLEGGRVDLLEVAEDAANRIMDDDLRGTEIVSDAAGGLRHLMRVGHIGGEGVRSGSFVRKLHQTLFGACDHGDFIVPFGEAPDYGGARSGTNAGHQRYLFGHARMSWEWAARRSRTKSRRSLPKNSSLSTKKVGTPKTPLCAATSLRRWSSARRSGDSARRQKCDASIPSLFRIVSRPTSLTISCGLPQIAENMAAL